MQSASLFFGFVLVFYFLHVIKDFLAALCSERTALLLFACLAVFLCTVSVVIPCYCVLRTGCVNCFR